MHRIDAPIWGAHQLTFLNSLVLVYLIKHNIYVFVNACVLIHIENKNFLERISKIQVSLNAKWRKNILTQIIAINCWLTDINLHSWWKTLSSVQYDCGARNPTYPFILFL